MNELIPHFRPFSLKGPLRGGFEPVLTSASLRRDEHIEQALAKYKGVPGIYFWLMKYEGVSYKIYIGSTRSLSRRLLNYMSEFQAHSPNDYKPQVFLAFINELIPGATLDLYFRREAGSLNDAETKAKHDYDPLLNDLPAPTSEAKEALKGAFSLYYRRRT
jgi:hypothetical protein